MIFFGKLGAKHYNGTLTVQCALYIDDDKAILHAFFPDGAHEEAKIDRGLAMEQRLLSSVQGIHPVPNGRLARVFELFRGSEWSPVVLAPGWYGMSVERNAAGADFTPVGPHAIDLSGLDLSGVYFGRANFRGAKLNGTKLRKTVLSGAHFDPGALAGLDCSHVTIASVPGALTSFDGMDFSDTDFTGAGFHGVIFKNCTLSSARFHGATFSDTYTGPGFENCKVMGVSFAGAQGAIDFDGGILADCDFTDARLTGSAWKDVALTGVYFNAAVLHDTSWSGCKLRSVDFGGASLAGADFSGTSLMPENVTPNPPKFGTSPETRTRFLNARLHTSFLGRDWSYCDLTGATIDFAPDFQGDALRAVSTVWPGAKFAHMRLRGANFQSAVLHGANFGNADLGSASFQDAVLNGSTGASAADFTGAQLELTDFAGADLSDVTFSAAYLKGAKFRNALLLLTSFTNAFLAEVEFTGIRDLRMAGVSFDNACLVSATFRGTALTSFRGKSPSFAGAILLGTDFTGASLSEANLTNAKLSTRDGELVAKIRPRPGTSGSVASRTLSYKPTILPPSITGSQTRCPDASPGPCDARRLDTGEPPQEWTLQR